MSYDSLLSSYSPLGWWKLADSAPGTSPADSSGNSLTGTKHGTITFGQTGLPAQTSETTALFDGSTGYVTAGLASSLTTNITLLGWVNIAGNVAGPVIFLGTTASNGFGVGVGGISGNCWENYNQNKYVTGLYANVSWLNSSTTLTTATWHMVAIVVGAAGHPTMYLDGTSVYSDSTNTPITPTLTTDIGWDQNHSGYLGATVGEVAVIGSALTGANLTALYSAGTSAGVGPEPFLVRQAVTRASYW